MTDKKYCCASFQEAISEGVFYFDETDECYSIDGYDVKGDYFVNYCPICGTKVNKTS